MTNLDKGQVFYQNFFHSSLDWSFFVVSGKHVHDLREMEEKFFARKIEKEFDNDLDCNRKREIFRRLSTPTILQGKLRVKNYLIGSIKAKLHS